MNNINTYRELEVEKQRLRLLLNERKILMEAEFENVKAKLKPFLHILDFTDKITTKDRHNPLINKGIEVGVNFLLKKVLLRNAGWVTSFILPLILKNYLSHEVAENPTWIQKIGHFLKKKLS